MHATQTIHHKGITKIIKMYEDYPDEEYEDIDRDPLGTPSSPGIPGSEVSLLVRGPSVVSSSQRSFMPLSRTGSAPACMSYISYNCWFVHAHCVML